MSVTIDDLRAANLDEQFARIDDAVANHLDGSVANVAVVSEPFAGRDVFLDYAESEFGAATGRVSPDAMVVDECPDLPDTEVVLVDDCHRLYTRQIGGFDVLETFLDRIAAADTLVISSWNRYAWRYLTATRDVDDAFPNRIQVPRLDAAQIADFLRAYHDESMPAFVDPNNDSIVRTLDIERRELRLPGDRAVPVPLPTISPEYLLSRLFSDVEDDAESVVYKRIARLSEGDPGVATELWDQSIRDGEIAPEYVTEVDDPIDVNDDEALVLELALTNEAIHRDRIDRIADHVAADRALQRLVQEGVVRIDEDGVVRIVRKRLYSTVEHLTARQLLW